MKLVTWNTKGINNLHKQKEIKLFLTENKVEITALLEHKIKEHKAGKVIQKIAQCWKWEANYEHTDKGRMWLLKSNQYIQSRVIVKRTSMVFCLVAIYGIHTTDDRLQQWKELGIMVSNRILGNPVQEMEIKDFNDFIVDAGMKEPKKAFKFFNCIANHHEFLHRVKEAWRGGQNMDLKELQAQPEKWSMIEESAMQQKSRIQWLRLGDANTAYFYAHMKNRVAQNSITRLMTSDGTIA
ncbi:hypothetical protein R3W88_032980 [Solanum pinnatisectum]|uniref:Uncharacterized protein n=1 Tax=Solanum pinnatisectum TaxID=50273 RepID=A0AAV9K3H5_9SOLN|nr:hypothetical protein R3W88_032980 [Solanum pinnatisectum]